MIRKVAWTIHRWLLVVLMAHSKYQLKPSIFDELWMRLINYLSPESSASPLTLFELESVKGLISHAEQIKPMIFTSRHIIRGIPWETDWYMLIILYVNQRSEQQWPQYLSCQKAPCINVPPPVLISTQSEWDPPRELGEMVSLGALLPGCAALATANASNLWGEAKREENTLQLL